MILGNGIMYELFHRFRKIHEFDPGFDNLRAKCEQFCSVWNTFISIIGPKVDVPVFTGDCELLKAWPSLAFASHHLAPGHPDNARAHFEVYGAVRAVSSQCILRNFSYSFSRRKLMTRSAWTTPTMQI